MLRARLAQSDNPAPTFTAGLQAPSYQAPKRPHMRVTNSLPAGPQAPASQRRQFSVIEPLVIVIGAELGSGEGWPGAGV
jgi:hypothetical protein